MFNNMLSAVLLTASLIAAGPAAAQDKPMKLESSVMLVQPAEDGGEAKLVAPDSVVPGDTLVFVTSYRNEGPAPVSNFVIVNPVPSDLVLSDEAAAALDVSVDGGMAWGRLSELSVSDAGNQQRPATSGDITHLRWVFAEIPPAGTGQVQFNARVR